MKSLETANWSALPKPKDDGACNHLTGLTLPAVSLRSTGKEAVNLSQIAGTVVLYIYPMTGRPDRPTPEGWEAIPGARGCTPQSCAFRDHFAELKALGVASVFGLSTQDTEEQQEAKERLHLPFELLSDAGLNFASALSLPTFEVEDKTLIKRVTVIAKNGTISKVFYPVFPPDQNAADVLDWLAKSSAQ